MRDGNRFPLVGSRDTYPTRGGLDDKPDPRVPEPDSAQPNQIRAFRTAAAPGSAEPMPAAPYVELHAHSAYSFLDGASLPEELAARAAELGYDAFALTDHDGVYGSLEFAHAAKHFGIRPITGAEVTLDGNKHVTLLCETQRGYTNLCRILTDAHADTRLPGKERDLLPAETTLDMLEQHAEGLVALSGCARHGLGPVDPNAAGRLARAFEGAFYVELQRPYERGDARRNAQLEELARELRVPTVATGDVHAHHLRRARLQDALVAIKHRTSLDGCERERRGNHESVLLPPAEMLERLPRDAALRSREIADRCGFDLTQELGYRYPDFSDRVDPADVQLRQICDRAFAERYAKANGHKKLARQRLDDELALIARLGLSGFFLLHWEVLELARECALEVRGPGSPRHALPPGRGRGSSVGSIVCYLTGLSHVDPVEAGLSLGRFINDEMVAVPDIDLDFPRDIREKLIVGVTERYGRERAALVASFATYRSRGAIRDVGKALGLPFAELERLARVTDGWDATRISEEVDGMPGTHTGPRWDAFRELTREIAGLPRHISQHPGGMVISTRPLIDLVPVQPAAMAGRQICQWDKDSCGDAGFLKIDLLGLGMLSAIEDAVDRIARLRGKTIDLSRVPLHDQGVYEEIQAADTVGVFQIESRAQMQSLLQTRPENLEDLTVQVALVRPGPIQGKAVHPYVKHRHAKRDDPAFEPPVEHESLREPLRDTLGVVVFQDQVLDVAMAAAGFSIGEAEGLRRAMSRKRSEEAIEAWRPRFVAGALENGIDEETAHQIYDKLCGFAGFGFPKSHAAAFALLAYQSAWLRRYYPGEFLCALMNAQPMGFYPPSSLVRDAQRRGVAVLAPHINRSDAQCGIEDLTAVRVGLAYVQSVGEEDAQAIVAQQPFTDLGDLARRAPVKQDVLEALVAAGACDEWGPRRELLWRLGVTARGETVPGGNRQLALPLEPTAEIPELPEQTPWERMLADYRHTSLSVGVHPLHLLRPHLPAGVATSADLPETPHGTPVQVAGMAIARQRPATANGIVFMLLEDEFGQSNLIVPSRVYEEHRAIVRGEPLILARGKLERHDRNINVVVTSLASLGPLARRAANEAEVVRDLPRAHHFGRR
ncbi:MAG: error-prone DNA polymerase [Thermoleophilia bacterium]|nr:error-prone DNA polymerase [Thermoleophilia bacterium]